MADTEVKQEAAWLKRAGIIVSVIQIILAVSFVGMVFWINIFPVKIEVIIIVVLIHQRPIMICQRWSRHCTISRLGQ